MTHTGILALLENYKSCAFTNRPQMPASLLPLFSQSCQNGLLQNVARPHVILPSKPSNGFSVCKKTIQSSWHALGGFCDLPPPPSSFLLLPDHTMLILCSRLPFWCMTYSLIWFRSLLKQHLHREVSLRILFQPCIHLNSHSSPLCSGAFLFAEHWNSY